MALCVGEINDLQAGRSRLEPNETDPRQILDLELRPREREAREALRDQIGNDLRYRQ